MSAFVSFEVDTRDAYLDAVRFAQAEAHLQVAEMYGKTLRDEDGNCFRCGAPQDDPDETCTNCGSTVFDTGEHACAAHGDFDCPEDECQVCGDHGVNEPTCDICDRGQCFTPDMPWNGETGNHIECEDPSIPPPKCGTCGGRHMPYEQHTEEN